MSDALDELVAQDVLTPVKTTEWATPVIPVLKKDGSPRICGDFRMTVNHGYCDGAVPVAESGLHFCEVERRGSFHDVVSSSCL